MKKVIDLYNKLFKKPRRQDDTHFCECFDNPKEENSCPICGQVKTGGRICSKCRDEFPVKK